MMLNVSLVQSRPAEAVEEPDDNSILKEKEAEIITEDNKTDKRGKDSDKKVPKNSLILKALDEDYEYEEYYDEPIIVIKFKRDTYNSAASSLRKFKRKLIRIFLGISL